MSKTSCFAPRIVRAMSRLARSILRTQGFDGSEQKGDGHTPVPRLLHLLETTTQATGRGRRPHALPSGTATNLVASPIFTRIRTACLPWVLASLSALRTSPTLATGFFFSSPSTLSFSQHLFAR